ncbi:MAG: ferrous iron transporter B [Flavobacteriales bacterium]|nr:ferrous iron transporter B [Flavobacteriales bacterium]
MRKIALIGNPNTGKSSLFNLLTGLNQQVGNFPGITVDKRTGTAWLNAERKVEVLDLPGLYSIYPHSKDEHIVFDILSNPEHTDHPELLIVLADASNLERNLLLFSQLYDLNLPIVLVLTMPDAAEAKSLKIDIAALSKQFTDTPVLFLNGRTGAGLDELKKTLLNYQPENKLSDENAGIMRNMLGDASAQTLDAQRRYASIRSVLRKVQHVEKNSFRKSAGEKLDSILIHPFWGYAIFIAILLVIFQFIYRLAAIPMNWIDSLFLQLSVWTKTILPQGVFTDLLAEGIVPGLGGVVIFVPQIALLFFFLSLLEETGYMSRVVFIMDKLVRPFGLNGKSVVPLMSSVACAIPGVMATRNINSWKDRLITIMVAPLMSCAARIPVYTLLIALVVPNKKVFNFFDLQGLVLFGLYSLGLVSVLAIAWVMKFFIKARERSFLLMEMPQYRWPRWRAVTLTMWEKVRVFVVDAGKVILAISIILWALASYGPSERMDAALAKVEAPSLNNSISTKEYESKRASVKLENSYIGILGKTIEPVIEPIGYDWKIGIALITSFAAREVFVGSMATIYSVGENFEDNRTLIERLRTEINPKTQQPVYTLASGLSLMVFYVFAMQCMATFAVVKRETNSWKWPLLQMLYMGVLAYGAAWLTFVGLK